MAEGATENPSGLILASIAGLSAGAGAASLWGRPHWIVLLICLIALAWAAINCTKENAHEKRHQRHLRRYGMKHARADYDRIQDPEGKIGQDEPVMLFRAQDKHFPKVLAYYLMLLGKDAEARPDILTAVVGQIRAGQRWQAEHGCKTPDLP
jgi:hypothetical protein